MAIHAVEQITRPRRNSRLRFILPSLFLFFFVPPPPAAGVQKNMIIQCTHPAHLTPADDIHTNREITNALKTVQIIEGWALCAQPSTFYQKNKLNVIYIDKQSISHYRIL